MPGVTERAANAHPLGIAVSSKAASDTQSPATARFRQFLPSPSDVIFTGVLLAVVFSPLATRLLGDGGIGWHIRAGEGILATGHAPSANALTATRAGETWFAWEWLFDATAAALHMALGLNGLVVLMAAVAAFTFALLFRTVLARCGNGGLAAGLTLLAVGAAQVHFLARPHVFTWLFVLLWFIGLEQLRAGKRAPLVWLPLAMAVWVNLHGGFVLGLALTVVSLAGEVWERYAALTWNTQLAAESRIRSLALLLGLSLLATLANPYSLALHAHIAAYLTSPFLMNNILEFRSPDFHGVAERVFALLLLTTIAALALAKRRLARRELLLVLLAVALALQASRNIPIAAILLALAAAPVFAQLLPGQNRFWSATARLGRMEWQCDRRLLPAALVVLAAAIASNGGFLAGRHVMAAQFDPQRFPQEAASFLATQPAGARVFSPDAWGGYLIYRDTGMRVVMDDRHDFYGEAVLRDYVVAINAGPGWRTALARFDADWVLLPQTAPLASLLRETNEWRAAYEDKLAVVFRRL